uniref:SJCHGC09834 protein n=1 Tax=Schistosoma japonicum TaxID=6182 RepID=Q5BQR7_SCHJA|nr:SJCHGC09834 protein [Schistosoma japonicum]
MLVYLFSLPYTFLRLSFVSSTDACMKHFCKELWLSSVCSMLNKCVIRSIFCSFFCSMCKHQIIFKCNFQQTFCFNRLKLS